MSTDPSSSLATQQPLPQIGPTTSQRRLQQQEETSQQSSSSSSTTTPSPTVTVSHLSYTFPDGSSGLNDVSLDLPAGSRTLLIGANGAGKTTLLRLLSGKRLSPPSTVSIGGLDPFKDGLAGVTYLGLEWVLNPTVRSDISVTALLDSVGGLHYPDRRAELISILDIDERWHLHAVSDGERRRVQLAMGLMRPWSVLLLDEITVDLDLLSRSSFLAFLRAETNSRPCTILYATHILDNLAGWPTHLVHMHLGKVKEWGKVGKWDLDRFGSTGNSRLGDLVLQWLKEDLAERGSRNVANDSTRKPTKSVNEDASKSAQGKTYQSFEGIGGYGQERRFVKP